MQHQKLKLSNLSSDIPAGLVVFLVALPLCLGIALASGAPLFSGIIAGIIGGVIVGYISGSHTSVSGPAAGLSVIVLNAIDELGKFEVFLLAVFLAGLFQLTMGVLKAGVIGYYFPSSVIKGMLAGIGIILIIKQLPYAFGVGETANFTDYIPFVNDWEAVKALWKLGDNLEWVALIISLISIFILILWEKPWIKKLQFSKLIPGPLVVVLLGVLLNFLFLQFFPGMHLGEKDRVILPVLDSMQEFSSLLVFPDFSQIGNTQVWIVAFTIGIIASLETLLSLEAADKIDPYKRISPPNKELIAQGTGNLINGLIGGLPVTAVIVRSSANVAAGAKSKISAIFHGFLLFGTVLLIPDWLNLIPLASLAAILLLVGYKLARYSLFKNQAKLGMDQFLPFIITILGIVVFDLLIGIGMGMGVAFTYILLRNFQNSHFEEKYIQAKVKPLKLRCLKK
jgi:MFS superfamily sulfate permease-like transporter